MKLVPDNLKAFLRRAAFALALFGLSGGMSFDVTADCDFPQCAVSRIEAGGDGALDHQKYFVTPHVFQ